MEESEKIRWGQVYSPADIVSYILEKTLVPALSELPVSEIKVLEPACGDGRFLVGIYELLMQEYQRQGWTPAAATGNILSCQLYGLDINAQAIDFACNTLQTLTGQKPDHITCGDTLDKEAFYPQVPLIADFYDVIVGNPPYVTWEIDGELRAYYRKHYCSAVKGRINLYRLFIERCLELLKPDGYLGFICPNTYLTDRDSSILRQLLLEQTHILEIVCLPESAEIFTDVTQATTILIVQKKQKISPTHQVCIKKLEKLKNYDLEVIYRPQKYWQEKTGGKFQLLPAWYEAIIEKLYCGQPLGNIGEIYQGEVNLTIHKKDLQDSPTNSNYPLIRGCHIMPYGFLPERERGKLSYIQPSRSIRDHARCKRLVLQQVSNTAQPLRLKCGLLTPHQPVFCANSTNYMLLPDQDITMYYYLMALCHSTVWNLLFSIGSSTNHVTVREMSLLPVPDCAISVRKHLADMVEKAAKTGRCTCIDKITRSINEIIYRLFSLDQFEVELIEKYRQICLKGLP
jgi:Alw26I/Eco31I/Esp3I family type II restriction m6 adenine DNA methyltransferase